MTVSLPFFNPAASPAVSDHRHRCADKHELQVSPELARSLGGGPIESSRALRQLLKDNGVELPVGASDAECARRAMQQQWPEGLQEAILKVCVMLLAALKLQDAMNNGAAAGGGEPSARQITHANRGKHRAKEIERRLPTPTGPKVGIDPKPPWLDPQPKVGIDPKPPWLDPQPKVGIDPKPPWLDPQPKTDPKGPGQPVVAPADPAKVRSDEKTRGDVKMLSRTVEDCAKDGWMDQPTADGFRARLQGLEGKLADGAPISEATQKEVDQLAGDIFRAQFGSPGKTDGAKVTETLLKSVDEIRGKALATRDEAASLRQRIQALGQEVSGPVDAAWIARASDLRREIVDTARQHYGKNDVPLE